MSRVLVTAVGALVITLIAIQLVPYGCAHSNPPVIAEPAWDSTQTRELAARACFDCHSNQTEWPWYSNVAPASWVIQRDVNEGREKLNFSEWTRPQEGAREAAESVQEGDMPPWYYLLPRPQAQPSSVETASLIQGLQATLGGEPRGAGERGRERR